MPKQIFEAGKKGIDNTLRSFHAEYSFTEEEIRWEIKESITGTMIFVMHEKIAKLIKEKFLSHKLRQEELDIIDNNNHTNLVTVSANNYESLFLLGLLSEIKEDLYEEKKGRITSNKILIQELLAPYQERKDVPEFTYGIYYRKKVYYISLRINGEKRLLTGDSVDEINRHIENRLILLLQEMLHEKMLKKEVQRAAKHLGVELPGSSIEVKTEPGNFSVAIKYEKSTVTLTETGSLALCEKIKSNLPEFICLVKKIPMP